MTRKRSVEIYLKEGIAEDDQLFQVWESLKDGGRPQEVFRRMLRHGLRTLIEVGELPKVAVEKVDLAVLVPMPEASRAMRLATGRSRSIAADRAPSGAVTGPVKDRDYTVRNHPGVEDADEAPPRHVPKRESLGYHRETPPSVSAAPIAEATGKGRVRLKQMM